MAPETVVDWVQCRARSPEGTYCVADDGHEGQHRDKWGYKWKGTP